MAVWTLTYDGTTKTFAEWGLKGLRRSQVSQATGSVTLTQSGASYDGTPLFAIDAPVTISKDGVPWHKGPVITVPRAASPKSEQLDYEIADPWWYLEQLTYEQPIAIGTGSGNTTRISLFGGVSGGETVKLSVYGVIINAIGLAVSAGASMSVSFLGSFGVSPPIADMRDPTCAEIIRAALRWVPDATMGWYYGTTPEATPVLIIATRGGAAARTIDLADQASVNLINIRACDELRRDAVKISYQITSTEDEETYTALVVDSAGSGSPFRTLKATLPLSGSQTQRQSQYLQTEAISEGSAAWWQRQVPALKDAEEVTISDGTIEPAEEGGDSFSRVIIDGQVPGWLDDPDAPVSGSMRVSAKATYKVTKEDGSEIEFKDDPISVVLSCTDLTTNTYSHVTSYLDGEPVPSGVAAALLAAVGVLQYDGKIKIKARECSFIARPGDVLNLTNGATAWATARMQVQKVDEYIDAGETLITFGPPKHLSPQDIVEMLRTLRSKPPVQNLSERATGKAGDGNKTQGGKTTANGNGNSASAAWHRVVSKSPDGTRTFILDAQEGFKMEDDDGSFIDHQIGNKRTLYQDADSNSCEVKPTKIELLDSAGDGVTLTRTGLVIHEGGDETSLTLGQLRMIAGSLETTIQPGSVVVANGSGTSTLEAAHLLLDEGGGITNSLTGEQIVMSNGTDTTIIEAGETSIANGSGDTLLLKPQEARTTDGGGNYASMSAEGGFRSSYDGYTASMYVGSVELDDGSGGTVDIHTVSGQNITFRDTEGCDVDEAEEPVITSTKVLRGEATA